MDRHYFIAKPNRPLRCNICFAFVSADVHIRTTEVIAPPKVQFTEFDLHWLKIIEKGDWMKGIYEP